MVTYWNHNTKIFKWLHYMIIIPTYYPDESSLPPKAK